MQKYTVCSLLVCLTFLLTVKATTKCPEDCNNHGRCISVNGTATCLCNEEWGGYTCADSNYNLTSDHALSVTIHKDEYYYFTLVINSKPPEKVLKYFVWGYTKQSNVKAPAMYVSHDYYPNSTHYEFVSNSTEVLRKNYTILHPKPGTWYLAVVGQDSNPLILTIQANVDNSTNTTRAVAKDHHSCSTKGHYMHTRDSYSKCVCTDTVSSHTTSCDTYAKPLLNGIRHASILATSSEWSYWYFNITDHIHWPCHFVRVTVSVTVDDDDQSTLPELQFLMTDIDTKHESVTSTSNTVTRTISYQPTQTSMKEDVLFIGISRHDNDSLGIARPYAIELRLWRN